MDFCEDCDNMLYIKIIDEEETDQETSAGKIQSEESICSTENTKGGLIYFCKCCGKEYSNIKNTLNSVYSINYNLDNIKKYNLINEYTLEDPTLPKANGIKCPNKECASKTNKVNNIVYINYDETGMRYIYACLDCYRSKIEPHIW